MPTDPVLTLIAEMRAKADAGEPIDPALVRALLDVVEARWQRMTISVSLAPDEIYLPKRNAELAAWRALRDLAADRVAS